MKTEDELMVLLWKARTQVPPGTYRHYKGALYFALFVVLREADHVPVVVYEPLGLKGRYGLIWCRPVTEWLEEVEYEGLKVPRFTREEPQ